MSLIQSYLLSSHITKIKDINNIIQKYFKEILRDIPIFKVKLEHYINSDEKSYAIYHQSINTLLDFIVGNYKYKYDQEKTIGATLLTKCKIIISCVYDGTIFNTRFIEYLSIYMEAYGCISHRIIPLINCGKYASITIT